jgi:hypothetical protein
MNDQRTRRKFTSTQAQKQANDTCTNDWHSKIVPYSRHEVSTGSRHDKQTTISQQQARIFLSGFLPFQPQLYAGCRNPLELQFDFAYSNTKPKSSLILPCQNRFTK